LSDAKYEVEQALEHMQKAYEKSATLPPGLRMMIWRERCRVENVVWYVKRRGTPKVLAEGLKSA